MLMRTRVPSERRRSSSVRVTRARRRSKGVSAGLEEAEERPRTASAFGTARQASARSYAANMGADAPLPVTRCLRRPMTASCSGCTMSSSRRSSSVAGGMTPVLPRTSRLATVREEPSTSASLHCTCASQPMRNRGTHLESPSAAGGSRRQTGSESSRPGAQSSQSRLQHGRRRCGRAARRGRSRARARVCARLRVRDGGGWGAPSGRSKQTDARASARTFSAHAGE